VPNPHPSAAEAWRQPDRAEGVRKVGAAIRWRKSLGVGHAVDGVVWRPGLDPGATYPLRATASCRGPRGHSGQWWPT
jgi:hypothetical protein